MVKYIEIGNFPRSVGMIIKPAFMQIRWNAGKFENTIVSNDFEDVFYDLARRGHCVYPYGVASCDLRYGAKYRFNEIMASMAKCFKSMHIPKPFVDEFRDMPNIPFGLPFKASVASFNERFDLERHYF